MPSARSSQAAIACLSPSPTLGQGEAEIHGPRPGGVGPWISAIDEPVVDGDGAAGRVDQQTSGRPDSGEATGSIYRSHQVVEGVPVGGSLLEALG